MRSSLVISTFLLTFTARAVLAGCTIETLYQGDKPISGIAADAQFIYVSEYVSQSNPSYTGVNRRIDRISGTVSDIAANGSVVLSSPPYLILATAFGVDALGPSGVVPLLYRQDFAGHDLAYFRGDGEFLYWVAQPTIVSTVPEPIYKSDGEIWRVRLSGGYPELVAVALPLLRDLWVDPDSVEFVSAEGLFRVPHDGGVPKLITSDANIDRISRVDSSGIWVTAIIPNGGIPLLGNELYRADRVEVRKIRWDDGSADVLASVPLHGAVSDVNAAVENGRIMFSVLGTLPRLAGPIADVFLVDNTVAQILVSNVLEVDAIDLSDGYFFAEMRNNYSTPARIVRMCDSLRRSRVITRR